MIKITITLLVICAIFLGCSAQDALISPKESYTVKLNQSKPLTDSYLVEVSIQQFLPDWATLVAHYHSTQTSTIVEIEFKVVFKENPNEIYSSLGRCRFEGPTPQWCKIGTRSPPLNLQHHLLKAMIDCPSSCEAEILIGMTETTWDGRSSPSFIGGPTPRTGVFATKKSEAMFKIAFWMVFTLVVILLAIKFAVKVADSFDKRQITKSTHQKKD